MNSIFKALLIFCLCGSYLFSGISSFETMFQKGVNLHENGEYKKAVNIFHAALQLSDSHVSEMKCLYRLGILFWNIGDIQKAQTFHEKGFALSLEKRSEKFLRKFKYSLEVIKNYIDAKKQRNNNHLVQSVEHFAAAAFFSEKLNSPELKIKCLRQLSISYWYMNEFEIFFDLNKKCFVLSKKLNHSKERCRALINLGGYYDVYDQYSLALVKYFEGLRIAEENDYLQEKSSCYLNISTIYLNLSIYDKAHDFLSKAYRLDKNSGNEEFIAQDLNNLGLIKKNLFKQNRDNRFYIDSFRCFYEGLLLAEKNKWKELEIKIIKNIGDLFFENDEQKKAVMYYKRGLDQLTKLSNLKSEVMLYINIGFSYLELEKPQSAIEYFRKALSSGMRLGAYHVLWEVYYGIGKYYEKQQNIRESIQWYEKSIHVIENAKEYISLDIHQAGYLSEKMKVYEGLLNLYFILFQETGAELYLKKMFSVAEMAKSNTLLENLQSSKVNIFDNVHSQLKASKSDLEKKMSNVLSQLSDNQLDENERDRLSRKFRRLEEEHMVLLSEIRLKYPRIAQVIAPEIMNMEDIQKYLIKTDSSIIEYFLGKHTSYIFLVTPFKKAVFPLDKKTVLENNIKGVLKYLSAAAQNTSITKKALRKISHDLIPFSMKLTGMCENLIIIPDGELFCFPFEVLIDEQNGAYLMDEFLISYMPSAFALMHLSGKQKQMDGFNLLFFGSPEYEQYENAAQARISAAAVWRLYEEEAFPFPSLPYSRNEVEEITKLFHPDKIKLFIGPEASESNIKNLDLSGFNCIHFACHGFISSNPFKSALVLSPETGEDGFLQAREIYDLKFNADLVVLSACSTGKGIITAGEGLLGLSRVFFYSGASSVISTLWDIDDKSTALFMKYFYGFLKNGMRKSSALRKAKLKMRDINENPFFWAPFILNGEFYGKLLTS